MSKPTGAYNLQSNKADLLQVSVQLQLADDLEFLSKLITASQQSKFSQENDSDTDGSESDLNCNDVTDQSDTEQTEENDNSGSTSSKDKSTNNSIIQ